MTGFEVSAFLVALPVTLATAAALQAMTLGAALRGGRHSVVDVTWGAGFAAVAAVACALGWGYGPNARRLLILLLTACWGLRLAGHILLRLRGHEGEDPRYEELLARGGAARTRFAVTHIYLPQGLTQWFVSLPVQMAMFQRGGIGVLGAVGVALWAVGFFFETVGDHQLTRFRRDPASKGRVLDTGLWRYTRHPNYFGDACVWWGLSLLAFAHWPGIVTIGSPVLMTYLLTRGTGAELLERTINDRRPGYADYVRRTSGFLPLPRKRAQRGRRTFTG